MPGADLAANLIGFTGDDHTGLEGLEARYDDAAARHRRRAGLRDRHDGRPGQARSRAATTETTPAQPGTSLQLTIDRDLQFEVQRILERADARRCNATDRRRRRARRADRRGAGPGQLPDLQRGRSRTTIKPADREDVATSVIADPGSIAQGVHLRRGAAGGRDHARLDAWWWARRCERGGYTFADTHPQPTGTKMTMPGVLAYSSNVGTILIADKLGKQQAVRVPAEVRPGPGHRRGHAGRGRPARLLAPDEWSGSASGSVPIGHERRRHADPDGRRVRGDRQRRHVHPAAPDQGDHRRPGRLGHRRPRRRRPTRCSARTSRAAAARP